MCYTSNGRTCTQYYPSFNPNATKDEVAMLGYCGLAKINPAHVLDYNSCVRLDNGLAHCNSHAGQPDGQATDMYLYVTVTQDSQ